MRRDDDLSNFSTQSLFIAFFLARFYYLVKIATEQIDFTNETEKMRRKKFLFGYKIKISFRLSSSRAAHQNNN